MLGRGARRGIQSGAKGGWGVEGAGLEGGPEDSAGGSPRDSRGFSGGLNGRGLRWGRGWLEGWVHGGDSAGLGERTSEGLCWRVWELRELKEGGAQHLLNCAPAFHILPDHFSFVMTPILLFVPGSPGDQLLWGPDSPLAGLYPPPGPLPSLQTFSYFLCRAAPQKVKPPA